MAAALIRRPGEYAARRRQKTGLGQRKDDFVGPDQAMRTLAV
jgi:hypothetical protein